MKIVTLFTLLAGLTAQSVGAQDLTIEYRWLNVPCATNINCDNGCSACNVPENSSPSFFGTNMIWPGLAVCPHPVSPQDNSLHVTGWPVFAESNVYGLLSGLTTAPVRIDSIIIRHRSEANGPQRLKVSFTNNASMPTAEVLDESVPTEWVETVITDLDDVLVGEGMAYGTFQLKVQAYQGNGGSWQLDGVRIVAAPADAVGTTGIAEVTMRGQRMEGGYVDMLGRSVGNDPMPGFYIGQKRVVRIP